jgi:hypothetical protein
MTRNNTLIIIILLILSTIVARLYRPLDTVEMGSLERYDVRGNGVRYE